jgi:hypothetical protein
LTGAERKITMEEVDSDRTDRRTIGMLETIGGYTMERLVISNAWQSRGILLSSCAAPSRGMNLFGMPESVTPCTWNESGKKIPV